MINPDEKISDAKFAELRRGTILKLNKVFKMGYVPIRGHEDYRAIISDNKQEVGDMVNCMGHACFNLTDQLLEEMGFTEDDYWSFTNFITHVDGEDKIEIVRKMDKFIQDVGLQVEPSSLDEKLDESCQWKIALYFKHNLRDFHFLLQERDGSWSSKMGSFRGLDYFDKPEEKILSFYNFHQIKKITNPYAKVSKEEAIEK